MVKITFSNMYFKLGYTGKIDKIGHYPLPKKGKFLLLTLFKKDLDYWLIGVSKCDLEKLPKEFLEHDTMYFYGEPNKEVYFVPDRVMLFTTLRSAIDTKWKDAKYKTKEDYYKAQIGKKIDIKLVLEHENPKKAKKRN
jgi:hypothetical protein